MRYLNHNIVSYIKRTIVTSSSSSSLAFTDNINRSIHTLKMSKMEEIPDDNEKVLIEEGTAKMMYEKKEAVFYNKVQVLNRDLSIQVIRLFAEIREKENRDKYDKKVATYNQYVSNLANNGKPNGNNTSVMPVEPVSGIRILDALAATGLRSIRYCKEIPGVREVTINDLDVAATTAAAMNCQENNVTHLTNIITGDACTLMYSIGKDPLQHYDVIDLDPYGSVSPFLDTALQAISDGGLLCVTCTDMSVLAGNYAEVCYAKYGSMPLKTNFMHEMSLRILLNAIETTANRHKRYIVPWISLSVDFYVRVFVRVYISANEVKKSCTKRIMVYQSTQCPIYYMHPVGVVSKYDKNELPILYAPSHFNIPAKCELTGGRLRVGGPFWGNRIHDQEIVDKLLRRLSNADSLPFAVPTIYRLTCILNAVSQELKDDLFYYDLTQVSGLLNIVTPSKLEVHSALMNGGYNVSEFHHEQNAIKTNAPQRYFWDIMLSYAKLHPPVGSIHKKISSSAQAILALEPQNIIDFTMNAVAVKKKAEHSAKFPPNPEENWGPKRRGNTSIDRDIRTSIYTICLYLSMYISLHIYPRICIYLLVL